MIHAYNEIYLNDVMHNLANFFDIGINAIGTNCDELCNKFINSDIAKRIENGEPNYLVGKSSVELLEVLLNKKIVYNTVPMNRTPAYWAGWVLTYTSWYLNRSFKEIIDVIPFSKIMDLYNPYHEAHEMKTVELIVSYFPSFNTLKYIREQRKLSQSELAITSGIKLRSIQCYEQNDIELKNAKVETVYALAKALDYPIEELIK